MKISLLTFNVLSDFELASQMPVVFFLFAVIVYL